MYKEMTFIAGWQDKLVKLIDYEEDWRSRPYLCSEGYPTIGFGFRIGPKDAPLANYQFTLPRAVGEVWLSSLLNSVARELEHHPALKPVLTMCNEPRQAILLSMAYQMGVSSLAQFKNTLLAIMNEDWDRASHEMLDSKWARQTPNRAQRHADQMLTGSWSPEYRISGN
ncbi:glycoside hydrolase family protein [Vibrio spartinae]|uniref:Lysozyme n=1 Tax=Vibrio spartinae TaxID=1918945 RepID=A0A1N6M5L0_9VIBR|nr:glycoside hydrolase family protein [Vibrio spartinae]SIO94636.1 hypothetical protein VSP9026_02362 [Vibrio spartinae]